MSTSEPLPPTTTSAILDYQPQPEFEPAAHGSSAGNSQPHVQADLSGSPIPTPIATQPIHSVYNGGNTTDYPGFPDMTTNTGHLNGHMSHDTAPSSQEHALPVTSDDAGVAAATRSRLENSISSLSGVLPVSSVGSTLPTTQTSQQAMLAASMNQAAQMSSAQKTREMQSQMAQLQSNKQQAISALAALTQQSPAQGLSAEALSSQFKQKMQLPASPTVPNGMQMGAGHGITSPQANMLYNQPLHNVVRNLYGTNTSRTAASLQHYAYAQQQPHYQQNQNSHQAHYDYDGNLIGQAADYGADFLPPQVGKYVDLQLLERESKPHMARNQSNKQKQRNRQNGPNSPTQSNMSKVFSNCRTTCYRATSLDDGVTYFIRRVHDIGIVDERCLPLINAWRRLSHSGVVELREVFTSDEFEMHDKQRNSSNDSDPLGQSGSGFNLSANVNNNNNGSLDFSGQSPGTAMRLDDSDRKNANADGSSGLPSQSLIFVHEYYSGARTLEERHFGRGKKLKKNTKLSKNEKGGLIPEQQIWSYTVQLTSVLRQIHTFDNPALAYRCLDASKIIVVGENRLKLSACAIPDTLNYCTNPGQVAKDLLQQNTVNADRTEDQRKLGFLLLALACNCHQREVTQTDLELVCHNYSDDLFSVMIALLGLKKDEKGQIIMAPKTPEVTDTMPYIGARFYTHLEISFRANDDITRKLEQYTNTGRLFRALMKICSICERPAKSISTGFQSGYEQWAETDQRYLIKLFRDYLFHAVDQSGRPWMNLNHVVSSLNKVDCSSREKITLTSRDEQNMFIVSFADVKRALDTSFQELSEKAPPLAAAQGTQMMTSHSQMMQQAQPAQPATTSTATTQASSTFNQSAAMAINALGSLSIEQARIAQQNAAAALMAAAAMQQRQQGINTTPTKTGAAAAPTWSSSGGQ